MQVLCQELSRLATPFLPSHRPNLPGLTDSPEGVANLVKGVANLVVSTVQFAPNYVRFETFLRWLWSEIQQKIVDKTV